MPQYSSKSFFVFSFFLNKIRMKDLLNLRSQYIVLLLLLHRNVNAFLNIRRQPLQIEYSLNLTIKHTLFNDKRFPYKKQ